MGGSGLIRAMLPQMLLFNANTVKKNKGNIGQDKRRYQVNIFLISP